MEVAMRKMLDDREAEGKKVVKVKVVAGEDDGGESKKRQAAEAEDEEVEEFYAILKRIRVAVKYFEKGKGGGKKAEARPAVAKPWSLSFQREDFDGTAEEKESVEAAEEEEEEEDAAGGFDLNAEPDCRGKTDVHLKDESLMPKSGPSETRVAAMTAALISKVLVV